MSEWMNPANCDAAATRLRASRDFYLSDQRFEGREAGRGWLLQDAEWEDVEAVRLLFGHPDEVDAGVLATALGEGGDELLSRLHGKGGHVEPSRAWIAGFVEGAAEAFGFVEARL